MHTTESERQKYREMWAREAYRKFSPGLAVFHQAYEWMDPSRGASFTDFGCGQGVVSDALLRRGHEVLAVDIAANAYKGDAEFFEACLWELPDSLHVSDYGYCADVMEHIPPEMVDDVLRNIAAKVRVSAFFQIALFPDEMGKLIGKPLHLSVFPADWWRDRLSVVFDNCTFRGDGQHLEAIARK